MVTLLLASNEDTASLNIFTALLQLGCWSEPEKFTHGDVFTHLDKNVQLLLISELHIHANNIDLEHFKITNQHVDEVLVLSRHVSSTNIPALTIHAIGIPGELPHGETGKSGGIKGALIPPSPRFSALYRIMANKARKLGLHNNYDITMEATHHGPILKSPTIYIEIGSTENEWSDPIASAMWAESISDCLGLEGQDEIGKWDGSGKVMIGLGGGHYVPRHKDIVSNSDVWLGHLIASYSMSFERNVDNPNLPSGTWRHSVISAIESTISAFPGGEIFVHLDRKSFKGWQRDAICTLLKDKNIPILRKKEII